MLNVIMPSVVRLGVVAPITPKDRMLIRRKSFCLNGNSSIRLSYLPDNSIYKFLTSGFCEEMSYLKSDSKLFFYKKCARTYYGHEKKCKAWENVIIKWLKVIERGNVVCWSREENKDGGKGTFKVTSKLLMRFVTTPQKNNSPHTNIQTNTHAHTPHTHKHKHTHTHTHMCRSRYVLFLVETSKLWTVIFIVP